MKLIKKNRKLYSILFYYNNYLIFINLFINKQTSKIKIKKKKKKKN